ncbi:DUF4388 domain-containing protein [Deferribacter autotrophicus]|uniref:DUF4388 domain-containing protein n=1 Tax=Deferribacter autotrophicus TaxID=500465 RepID=A0A5A8F7M7_9BACT|nr:DUF4388 domain-containing protein [Deferribacter autotrophicus]KAA0259439.1 DUF4388 domain-containing protein [Deferribacter autotrophicus]
MAFNSQLIGDLKSISVPDVFQWVSQNRKSGFLFFQRETEEVKVFFSDGFIINTSSNIPEFLLGKLLIRYKKIDKKNLANVLKTQLKEKRPLGQLLIAKGFITKDELNDIIKQQIIEITVYLLGWDKGYFYFEEKRYSKNLDFSISVDEILFECIRRKDELDLYKKVLDESDIIKVVDSSDLSGDLKKFIDGKRCIGEILFEIGGDYLETYKQLYQLFLDKKIEKIGKKEVKEDPTVSFLVALELYGRGRIYESYNITKNLYDKYKSSQIIKNFYQNLVIFVNNFFEKKVGGENSCFKVNSYKLLDQRIFLTPKEGFILSRISEYPCFDELYKVVNIEKTELKLVLIKLYKLNLIMLKEIRRKETKELEGDTLLSLLYIMKNELTGALEVINEKFTGVFFFESGKFKIGYSFSENYNFSKYLQNVKDISLVDEKDFSKTLKYIIDEDILSFDELKRVLEVYDNMLIQEIIKTEPISNIFIFNEKFTYDISISLNLFYLILFVVSGYNVDVNVDFDLNQSYELTVLEKELLEMAEEYHAIVKILSSFDNNRLDREVLRQFSSSEINILKILYYLDLIKPVSQDDLDVDELKEYLNNLQKMTPYEIFGVNKDSFDIDEVKKTYVNLSKKYHPDLYEDKQKKALADEIFRIIKEAFDLLTSKEKEEESELKIDAKKIFLAEQLLTSGKIYLNMGRISDAVDSFMKAYENFGQDEEIRCYYGLALIKLGRFQEGFKILNSIDFTKFNDPNLYFAFMDASIKLGKKEKARKILNKFITEFKSLRKKAEFYQRKLSL